MADLMLAASSYMQELLYISKDIIWKDTQTALKNEDVNNSYEVELYLSAMRGDLIFENVISYSREVLERVGLDADIIPICMEDRNAIPYDLRTRVVQLQAQKIIADYEEKNSYYRQLNGQPPLDDLDFVYNTKYPSISDDTTPIHELSITQIYALEAKGYLDELCATYPSKTYLKHLGSKKISPYIARIAERFSILYMNNSEFSKINTDFRDTYNVCRYALIRSMYVPEKRKSNDLYDNFMALCVLFMTIQQMLAKYLDADIIRDFYDYESLKYVYDSYNVPFYTSIPLEYHIKIIKNINILLRYKGSTKVFFKLFEIFNFGDMDVFDFYILKKHKFENGKPVFKYKEDGSEDTRAMYELEFGQVQLYNNPPLELSDPANHIPYEDMTLYDPYWISDKDLLDKLYDSDFNYTESKYIGIRTVFDLMAMIYESCYFFKMLIDNREYDNAVSVYFNALNQSVDLFTLVIYISALMCKKYGYEGELNGDSVYVAKLLGFNFKEDLTTIQEYIKNNPYLYNDTELIENLTNMNVNSLASINATIGKIQNLHNLFISRRSNVDSKDAFLAYTHLEKILMASSYANDVFKKSNGTAASSFSDLLGDLNSQLYARLNSISSDIDNELDTVLILMRQSVSNLKYIEMSGSNGANSLIEHLFHLLEFFKSAKAELTGYEIGYTLAKRGESILRFFSDVMGIRDEMFYYDMFDLLTDEIASYTEKREQIYKLFLKVNLKLNRSTTYLKAALYFIDKIICISEVINRPLGTEFEIHDILYLLNNQFMIKDKLTLYDDLNLISETVKREEDQYLVNDWFDSFDDKLIDSSAINNRINIGGLCFEDELKLISETVYTD